jgi:hypothetical protein
MLSKQSTGFSQSHTPTKPVKQWCPKLVFQGSDLNRQGGLRNSDLLSAPRKILAFRNSEKIS